MRRLRKLPGVTTSTVPTRIGLHVIAFLRWAAAVLLLLAGVATIVFFLIHLIPGDPAAAMLGDGAAPADVAALRHELGLDLPVQEQYIRWFSGLVRGDLGRSVLTKRPVMGEILRALPATITLAVAAFLAAVAVAVPTGVAAALRRGRWLDHALRMLSLAGVSTPNYVSAPILVLLFSVSLGLLPVSGRDGLASLVLPAATLGLSMAALLSRMVRASVVEELGRPYFAAALSRGEAPTAAALRHAGRNALPPILVVAGLQIGSLLTGAVVTETIFSWPGIGRLLIQSIQRRDYTVVQGCVLFIAFVYSVVNALVDLLVSRLDPRTERSARPRSGPA